MTPRATIRLLIATALISLSIGCSEFANREISQTIEDASISSEVARQLESHREARSFSRIDVETERALVYLSGSVPDDQAERLAVEIARNVSGVRGVRSNLVVDEPPNDTARTRRSDDDQMTAEIQWRLATDSARASFAEVEVSTRRGVVTLTGDVPDDTSKRLATQLAGETDGVRRVIDRLQTTPQAESPKDPKDLTSKNWDEIIQFSVLKALANEGGSAYEDVTAETRKRTVYLAGTVDTAAQKARAATVAREVGGVRQVVNRLQVANR